MDYKTRITPAKEEAVKALRDEFTQYSGYIFTDFRGMTVKQITDLRNELRKCDAAYRVVKNRFARIAMKDLGIEGVDKELTGATAIALAKKDTANEVAKALYAAIDDGDPLVVKSALIDGKPYDATAIEAYSKLPSRLELLASLMGTMKAPVQKLAATLLAYKEKLEAGADAPAATEN
ncbi:MAG: 50S ribosomal protein L10 [Spirochaetia bacterium]|jgi:large subunit ribosomal protein L10|nr:50S ribosomal protein L10 [Spirochaetia bacterium]